MRDSELPQESGCYLIHAHSKLHHAQHYIGYADNIRRRIERHRRGDGGKLVRAYNDNGIEWEAVRIWVGEDRSFERRLHGYKNSPSLCPVCREAAIARRCLLTLERMRSLFGGTPSTVDMLRLTMCDVYKVQEQ